MRKDDPNDLKKKFFRTSDRFFQANGQWFFSAREGDIGPFRTREQANREALAYIKARNMSAATPARAGAHSPGQPTVIPGYIYRSVLSMEEQVGRGSNLVLDLEDGTFN